MNLTVNSSWETMLKEFHNKYGHLVSNQATLSIPHEVKALRYKLIKEEVEETFTAMGFIYSGDNTHEYIEDQQDIVEIADGIADSIYVLIGTAVAYGFPIERIFLEVHRSNMTKTAAKVEPGQKYGTKTPKGPDFIPPDIKGIIFEPHLQTQLEILHGGDMGPHNTTEGK